jgi:hypothetical protein
VTYRSKVDWWIALLLAVAVLTPVISGYVKGAKGQGAPSLISLLAGGVILALVWPTRYTINSSELKIRSGVLRWKIPLSSIVRVHPTSNPLSSPALSLDRLQIDKHDGGKILISPKDKDGFLNELATRTGLRRLGDRLLRDD